jgi:hypothetical protein
MSDINQLSAIDRVRLLAHGSLGDEPAEEGNLVSFSKAKREQDQAKWRRRVERALDGYDDAG